MFSELNLSLGSNGALGYGKTLPFFSRFVLKSSHIVSVFLFSNPLSNFLSAHICQLNIKVNSDLDFCSFELTSFELDIVDTEILTLRGDNCD